MLYDGFGFIYLYFKKVFSLTMVSGFGLMQVFI